jgi:outer membrane murein-binding lipoprotein Lpp
MDTADPGNMWHLLSWAIAGMSSAIAGLAGLLYRKQESRINVLETVCDRQQKAIDDCTSDRTDLRVKVGQLERDVDHLKSQLS